MRAACYVVGCGNVFFLQTILESIDRFAPPDIDLCPDIDLWYVLDRGVQTDLTRLCELFDRGAFDHLPIIRVAENTTAQGSINALWNWTVAKAARDGVDIAIVLNDDVYISPGSISAILRVFQQNEHVALCGIPAPGQVQDELHVRERWFMDPSLFYGPDFDKIVYAHKGMQPKYQGWTSGPFWACRVKPWLEHAVIPSCLHWGYGESWTGLSLYKAGWYTMSIYDPLILHYGGGAYFAVHSNSVAHEIFMNGARSVGDDAKNFATVWGTSELGELHEKWQKKFDIRSDVPPIHYSA